MPPEARSARAMKFCELLTQTAVTGARIAGKLDPLEHEIGVCRRPTASKHGRCADRPGARERLDAVALRSELSSNRFRTMLEEDGASIGFQPCCGMDRTAADSACPAR